MIKHIVFFRFKASVTQPERQEFLKLLRTLPATISELISFEAGFNLVDAARNYDLALIASCADLPALERYAKHADHQPVIVRSRELCEQTAAVDYEC